MRTPLFIPVFLALTFAQPALAQNTKPQPNQSAPNAAQSKSPDQDLQALPQQLQQTLQEAGLTDVKVMPHSFLVHAKDREGNPVMMVISPDSLMAVTEIPSTTGKDK